ncbi:MAG: DUF2066 domain-containing protein [Colwellia sp.]|nr:DUF2066 domain-containing protein [Colwellia sp.]
MKIFAVDVENLYNAQVIVNSQINSERKRALQQAMRAVVLKVGGQHSLLSATEIRKAVKNVSRYVANYRYQRNGENIQLMVNFDENKINQLFEQINAPIWGRLRPKILLWLVEERGLTRTIVSTSTHSLDINNDLPQMVEDFSSLRGLPIIMPLMDLTDANNILTFDVWGRFATQVQAASVRYNPEAIIIVRLSNSSLVPLTADSEIIDQKECLLCKKQKSQYALDWSFIADAQSSSVDEIDGQIFGEIIYGPTPKELLQQALSTISDKIYQKYALMSNGDNRYIIDVANISSLKRFIKVEQFLQQLSSVKTVKLLSASGDNRRFELSLKSSGQALLASLKLNKQLKHYIDPLAVPLADSVDVVPVFYWEP